MLIFQQAGQRVGKGFGGLVAGGRVQRNVNLQPLRAGGLGETLQAEVLKDFPQPHADLRALHDVGGWSGIEIEHHHGGTADIFCQRKRGMQFDGGQVRHPDHRAQIVGKNVVDRAPVALAPDGRGLHPVGPVRGGVLLEEILAVHAVGITLQGERTPLQMRNQHRPDAGVVVNDLPLGEAGCGIQDLVQIGQLQLPALNFNHRCSAHAPRLRLV